MNAKHASATDESAGDVISHRRELSTASTLGNDLSSPESGKYGDDGSEKYSKDSVSDDDNDDEEGHDDGGERDRLLNQDTIGHGPQEDTLPIDEDERPANAEVLTARGQPANKEKDKPVSWSSLPRKDQLFILTMARLSEPLTQTSLQAYMFYQLKSFDPKASDGAISQQAGMLQAAFTGAQFCTAILWGRLADSEKMGRKKVVLIGLTGTALGALGFGFSSTFTSALIWRVVGGALNGNIGVMRTMISEIIREKKFQSRAFLLLPMTFNIGVIIGPILGGLLADPVGSYPSLFGKESFFGGASGVWWMQRWPYALPNLVSAVFLAASSLAFWLFMEESLEALREKQDIGLRIGSAIKGIFSRRPRPTAYEPLSPGLGHVRLGDIEMEPASSPTKPAVRGKLPLRRIWTWNVLFVLLSHAFMSCHVGTFNSLWFVYLSTPRYNPLPSPSGEDLNPSLHLPPDYHPHAPFTFTGGLGLPPARIGTALAILGVIGISLQLLLFPKLSFKLGTTLAYRLSLLLFPIAYTLVPFLSIVPSSTAPPAPAAGFLFWLVMIVILGIQVLARTFALPTNTILVNNCSPHPSVLGTIHGIGQSVSSAMRCVGPIVGGYLYGKGLSMGVVGLVWWSMAAWAAAGSVAGCWVREGNGHEILLPGEEEEVD